MAVSYKKLFHLMIQYGISAADLTNRASFGGNIMTRIRRNQYVSFPQITTAMAEKYMKRLYPLNSQTNLYVNPGMGDIKVSNLL